MARTEKPREVLEGGRLKGGIFRSHLNWVREHHPDRLDELLGRLPADSSKMLGGIILPSSWYPFAALIHPDRTISEMFAAGNPEILRELGQYSARINLSTTYKALNRDSNHEFFSNSAVIHSQFQDFGTVEYVRTVRGGRMIHRDNPCFSVIFCASSIGYYAENILSHGAHRSSVIETECQCFGEPTCTFEMEWA